MQTGGDDYQLALGTCVFEEAHDGLLLVDSVSLSVLDANPAACRVSGRKRRDLAELKLTDLFHEDVRGSDSLASLIRACHEALVFHCEEGLLIERLADDCLAVAVSVVRLHSHCQPISLVAFRDVSERIELKRVRHDLEVALSELSLARERLRDCDHVRALRESGSLISAEADGQLVPAVNRVRDLLAASNIPDEIRTDLVELQSRLYATLDIISLLKAEPATDVTRVFDISQSPVPDPDVCTMSVLLVDDDRVVLQSIGKILKSLTAHVTLCGKAADALETVSHEHVAVMFIALDVRDEESIRLIQTVQEQSPSTMVIIISNRGEDVVRSELEVHQIHVESVIEKPVSTRALGRILRMAQVPTDANELLESSVFLTR